MQYHCRLCSSQGPLGHTTVASATWAEPACWRPCRQHGLLVELTFVQACPPPSLFLVMTMRSRLDAVTCSSVIFSQQQRQQQQRPIGGSVCTCPRSRSNLEGAREGLRPFHQIISAGTVPVQVSPTICFSVGTSMPHRAPVTAGPLISVWSALVRTPP